MTKQKQASEPRRARSPRSFADNGDGTQQPGQPLRIRISNASGLNSKGWF